MHGPYALSANDLHYGIAIVNQLSLHWSIGSLKEPDNTMSEYGVRNEVLRCIMKSTQRKNSMIPEGQSIKGLVRIKSNTVGDK